MSRVAHRISLIDHPNHRSSHSIPTPRGGGIGIVAAFVLSAVVLPPIINGAHATIWIPIIALSLLAFLGDRFELSPKVRLLGQLFLVTTFIVLTSNFTYFSMRQILLILLWTVFIVGTANFYNFMDGINGIAGITGVIGFALLAVYIYLNKGATLPGALALSISLACLGFLPFNLPRAQVFMGDIGSIFLGSIFGCLIYLTSDTFMDFACMSSFILPMYLDELTTMVFRLKNGENLIKAHRKHVYQLLANEKSIPHWKVSSGFGLVQSVAGLCILGAAAFSVIAVIITISFYLTTLTIWSIYWRSSLKLNH